MYVYLYKNIIFCEISWLTLDDMAVGCRTTLPSSLSSRESMEADSVYSFTFTLGSGCVVVKSPCVSHLQNGGSLITKFYLNHSFYYRTILCDGIMSAKVGKEHTDEVGR